MKESKIDIVIPWVDGSDPEWQKERAKYRPETNADGSVARFENWGLFDYWFRSVEQYAPWVRKIHLITWGHLPPWLKADHPKLNVVRHEDYIPAEYLPTFSSHVIELNLHRIPDLSDTFLYFNDDLFFNTPCSPEDFFRDGVPLDSAVSDMVRITDDHSFMPYIYLNNLGHINQHYSRKECVKKHFSKWFSPRYGLKNLLFNAYLAPVSVQLGFRNFHSCMPYRKETFVKVWDQFGKALHETCCRRFRSREDVNQYLFRYVRLMEGDFVPASPNCAYYTVGEDSAEQIVSALKSGKKKIICINDDPCDKDLREDKAAILSALREKFATPSSFERETEQ